MLIITNSSDHSVDSVTKWLEEFEQPYLRFNTDKILSASINFAVNRDSKYDNRLIAIGQESVDVSDIKSVWYRRVLWPLHEGENLSADFYIQQQWRYSILSLASMVSGYWVNHPFWGKNIIENNKLYQLKIAAQLGLGIPDTLLSNSYDDIIGFCKKHGNVVACKPLYSKLMRDQDGVPFGIYTQRLSLDSLIGNKDAIGITPMIVQEYIEKFIEIRATIIGTHIFACEIHSQESERTKNDWRRYDFDKVMHSVHYLPKKMNDQLLSFMKKINLNYGAVDLILTPQGQYVFLEVNPNGQYGWIEVLTEMPITRTIAHTLIDPLQNGCSTFTV